MEVISQFGNKCHCLFDLPMLFLMSQIQPPLEIYSYFGKFNAGVCSLFENYLLLNYLIPLNFRAP